MILKPLRIEQFECLTDIFKTKINESNLQEKATVEDSLQALEKGYNERCVGAYVDDAVSPKHCIILSHFHSSSTESAVARIHLIHSDSTEHESDENLQILFQTAENYAKLNGCAKLIKFSRVQYGSQSDDSTLLTQGFEPQEVIYVKEIK